MGKIKIVGLGPGSPDDLTLKALNEMERSRYIYLRTSNHPVVKYLEDRGITYQSFDYLYDNLPTFDEVYQSIAQKVIEASYDNDIIYAVPGHPLVAEDTVQLILALGKEKNIDVEIIPSISFIDSILNVLSIDPIGGLKILDGLQLEKQRVDTDAHNIITQVYNRRVASDVKLKLMEYYEDETEVVLIRAAGIKEIQKIEKMPLYEIDRVQWVDHLTSLYIPPSDKKKKYDFLDLVSIMERLRGPGGCPWDRKQTHESLKQYLLEETYEVLEAIDKKDTDMLIEELGDVLLQIVFHAKIGSEDGEFNIWDITNKITEKMINRHPHIFGDVSCAGPDEVEANWDKIKRKEQGTKTITDSLRHIPANMPALMRSYKIQGKAARVGFDWDDIEGAIYKVKEELQEVLDVYKSENYGKILEELGDLLFAVVNVCRFKDIQPEFALNKSCEKFINRFEYIENNVIKSGRRMQDVSLKELDELWDKAKMNNF